MSYDGRAIANFVLDRCDQRGWVVTNLALQKILYFCHAWSLALLKRPLIKHQFEAWKYGPVLQYVYRDFKEFDRAPITSRAKRLSATSGQQEVVGYKLDAQTMALVASGVDFYVQLKPGTLVELSHTEGGPWDLAWNHKDDVNPGMKISDSAIEQYFSSRTPPF